MFVACESCIILLTIILCVTIQCGYFTTTGSDHPAHKHLKHVRVLIATKWYDIGLELMEEEDVKDLHVIKAKYATDISKACEEMLELWLRKRPKDTWNNLINAMKCPDIELNDAADKIEKMLIASTQGMHYNSLSSSLICLHL